jgi:small subunit ribosomal protein S30e
MDDVMGRRHVDCRITCRNLIRKNCIVGGMIWQFTDHTTRNLKTIWEKVPARCPTRSSASNDRLVMIVHGSLARAGKVRAQTPKVEKQEKKKQPRGRAKKRMLYNRR